MRLQEKSVSKSSSLVVVLSLTIEQLSNMRAILSFVYPLFPEHTHLHNSVAI